MGKGLEDVTGLNGSLLDTIKKISMLGYKGSGEIQRIQGFTAYHVKEPYLSIGAEEILYPLEFKDVRKFYTSSNLLRIRIKPFIADKYGVSFFEDVKNIANKYQGRYNFRITFESPEYEYNIDRCIDSMVNYIRNISQSSRSNEYIVMLLARELGGDRYNRVKAYGAYYKIPTHIINLDKVCKIVNECNESNRRKDNCPAYITYMLNNYVQLYAKSGGIPWVVSDTDASLLQGTVIVGLAASKLGNTNYIVGVSYAVAYIGKEVRSYIYSEIFEESELDIKSLEIAGLYIPARIAKNIFTNIREALRAWNINKYVIYQTTIIHPDEIKGLTEALSDNVWILAHVKESGFIKRVYDSNSEDWGPYRGLCLIDDDSVGGDGSIKALLLSTGIIRIKRYDYKLKGFVEEEKRTYKSSTTPEPLELEIFYNPQIKASADKSQVDVGIALYTCRLALLLGKLDWEAYTSWPKIPFVQKYAKRIADILSLLYRQGDESSIKFANNLMATLQREPRALRYIM